MIGQRRNYLFLALCLTSAVYAEAQTIWIDVPGQRNLVRGTLDGYTLIYTVGTPHTVILTLEHLRTMESILNADGEQYYRCPRSGGGYSPMRPARHVDSRIRFRLSSGGTIEILAGFHDVSWDAKRHAFRERAHIWWNRIPTGDTMAAFNPQELLRRPTIVRFDTGSELAALVRNILRDGRRASFVPLYHIDHPPIDEGTVSVRQFPLPLEAFVINPPEAVFTDARDRNPSEIAVRGTVQIGGVHVNVNIPILDPHNPDSIVRGRVVVQGAPDSAEVTGRIERMRAACSRILRAL